MTTLPPSVNVSAAVEALPGSVVDALVLRYLDHVRFEKRLATRTV